MQIVLMTEDGHWDLDVVVHDPDATVADLAAALRGRGPGRAAPPTRSTGGAGPGETGLRSEQGRDGVMGSAAGEDRHLELEADGVPVPGHRRLDRAGIRSGSLVYLVESAPAEVGQRRRAGPPEGPDAMELSVVGGLDAGARVALTPGRWDLGRGVRPHGCLTRDPGATTDHHAATGHRPPGRTLDQATTSSGPVSGDRSRPPASDQTHGVALAHDTVSARHAHLEVTADGSATLADAGSRNGTWIDGVPTTGPTSLVLGAVARVGAVQVTVRPVATHDAPTSPAGPGRGGATVPFNRPPRPAPPGPPDPLPGPEPPGEASLPAALGVMAVMAPLVLGGVLVLVTGQLTYALFLLLSPVLVVGNAVDARRRGRRVRRRGAARYARALADLRAELARRAEDERARRAEEVPDPAELLRRIDERSTRLWERRPGHDDWLLLRAGLGPDHWDPPVEGTRRTWPDEVAAAVRESCTLTEAPVPVDLSGGGVVGVIGPRPATLAVARSLVVQAAALHGPADLPVLVMTGPDRAGDWDWAKWLPHTLDPGGSGHRLITVDPDGAEALSRSLLAGAGNRAGPGRSEGPDGAGSEGTTALVVVDHEALTEGRRAPVRAVLRGRAGPVAGIVVASSEDRLPSACTTVVEVLDGDGTTRVHRVRDGVRVDGVLATGISSATARRAARGLARFEDPEQEGAGAGLPPAVALLPLLGLDPPEPAAVARRWAQGGSDPDLTGPLGVTEDGVLAVDLVRDGPHGLVAGTTGAGKSELLRSLVAGLAAGSSPEHCTFVLVDFKGGSAFDRCARLPHTVGLVTDLDAHLAERALRCLEAELRYRERVLRRAGAADLSAYRRLVPPDAEPLPRLVVVVDEFATLKAELPDFVTSLVGVAQRGRSLGVHLVLATQRPSGAVSEDIRANANLRIALRVQDPADSHDVIDGPEAAGIGRSQPGRAWVRFGPGDVVALQTALSSGRGRDGPGPVEVRPFAIGGTGPVTSAPGPDDPDDPDRSDLALLVEACRRAHAASGCPPPRRPWPDPLPARVDLCEVMAEAGPIAPFGTPGALVPLARADQPDDQAQVPAGWLPAEGNLLLAGLAGSGTTTALATVALSAATTAGPDDLHLYVLDMGRGELGALAGLPHTGAVVGAGEGERQARLVRWLRAELDRRRGRPAPDGEPRILVLVDGLDPFRAEWEDVSGAVLDAFDRVFAEGPTLGLHMAVAADRARALPPPLRSLVRHQLLFRLADDLDYAQAGLRPAQLPTFGPGRAVEAEGGREVQVAQPATDLAAAVAAVAAVAAGGPHRARNRPPAGIGVLPATVSAAELVPAMGLDSRPHLVPLGIGEATLAPVGLVLHEGEHALIAGPARSGRSTALAVVGTMAVHAGWRTVVVAGRRSSLGHAGDLLPRVPATRLATDLDPALDRAGGGDGPLLLLVDDAEAVDPEGRYLPALLARPGVVVVASARADAARRLYGHWLQGVRSSRVGVLLQPDPDLDGDLLGVHLPRRTTTPVGPGRGYVCLDGEVELLQVAQIEEP